mmetsp:Transcript_60701/g.131527  ORF Transcript_60701/g.131527 Transcript_60701/m.131527 type:complete len:219 (-) Transcript_60701:1449-2105(-)
MGLGGPQFAQGVAAIHNGRPPGSGPYFRSVYHVRCGPAQPCHRRCERRASADRIGNRRHRRSCGCHLWRDYVGSDGAGGGHLCARRPGCEYARPRSFAFNHNVGGWPAAPLRRLQRRMAREAHSSARDCRLYNGCWGPDLCRTAPATAGSAIRGGRRKCLRHSAACGRKHPAGRSDVPRSGNLQLGGGLDSAKASQESWRDGNPGSGHSWHCRRIRIE